MSNALVSLGTRCRHQGLILSGSARLTNRLTNVTPWSFGKLPRCTLYVWNTFIPNGRPLHTEAHYGQDMHGSYQGGNDVDDRVGKDEGLALTGDIGSEVNKSDNICGRCRKGVQLRRVGCSERRFVLELRGKRG